MQNTSVFSISQINEYIKMTLETSPLLSDVWLRGEISNFKSNYSSGHLYFSLKDERSSIRAVMFRSYAQRLGFKPESGMKVLVHGKISAYTVAGDYQILISEMQPDGAGNMALAFEQLKRRLEEEGLFAKERKKPIPYFSKRVGVITSASGAALHDIINVSGRRCPSSEIVIYPAYVQGELAPKSLKSGILYFNNKEKVDVIIIGRGGGSAEDLWCFNDEALARAIADSKIPVISAVGHETDFTICDFVSDLRAPTPSAAAEIAFPDTRELRSRISYLKDKACKTLSGRISNAESRIAILQKNAMLHSPEKVTDDKILHLARLSERAELLINDKIEGLSHSFALLCARAEGVNPLSLLSRGYAMAEGEKGVITSVSDVAAGDRIKVRFADGEMSAEVISKKKFAKRKGQG